MLGIRTSGPCRNVLADARVGDAPRVSVVRRSERRGFRTEPQLLNRAVAETDNGQTTRINTASTSHCAQLTWVTGRSSILATARVYHLIRSSIPLRPRGSKVQSLAHAVLTRTPGGLPVDDTTYCNTRYLKHRKLRCSNSSSTISLQQQRHCCIQ